MDFKKKGTLFMPVKPVVFEFKCIVDQPMRDISGKMYIYLNLDDEPKSRVHEIHKVSNQYLNGKVINPLEGNVIKVKIPYKYNKVTCKVSGNKVLQELVKGDQVTVVIEYCGVWAVNGYCGPSWKLFNLNYQ